MTILNPQNYSWATANVEQSETFGHHIGRLLTPADVVVLEGPLGAGKTALVRGIARGWGTLDRVTSPTYVLVQQYERPSDSHLFFHLDCYRLASVEDAETIGLEDILAADGPAVIEWGKRILKWLPADHLLITITPSAENERYFHLTAYGPRGNQLIADLRRELTPQL